MPSMLTLIHQSTERQPEHLALRWKEDGVYQSMSYGELWTQIQSAAHALQEIGVRPTSKVAILANNCPQWTVSDLAIMACGAVTVPIYPTVTPQQVAYILQNADVEVILVENDELAEKVRQALEEPGTEQLHTVVVIRTTSRLGAGQMHWQEFLLRGRALLAAAGEVSTWRAVTGDTLATIVHTSGTTGNPKGVMLTHRNLVDNAQGVLAYVPVRPEDITLSYLPLSHIFERTCGQFGMLIAGATICFAESLNTITTNLVEVRPTLMTSVPRLFEKIYDGVMKNVQASPPLRQKIFRLALKIGQQRLERETLLTKLLHPLLDKLVWSTIRERMGGRIRLLVSGGAALSPTVGEFLKIAGLNVCEGYGMTETAPVVSCNPTHDLRVGTVGQVLRNTEIKIAADGELLVRGTSVMLGYYKDEEATRKSFDEEGFLYTGDIAEVVDGYLRIIERKKNILVLATGKNVAPFPIEAAMSRSPFISQAVLIGDKRKYVSALLVPDFDNLKAWAAEQGLSYSSNAELVATPQVQVLFASEVKRELLSFADYEKPKKFTVLPSELSMENGQLTATLKVRTHVLTVHYQQEIEAMYAEGTSQAV